MRHDYNKIAKSFGYVNEKDMLESMYAQYKNKSEMARELGINPATLANRLRNYGLSRNPASAAEKKIKKVMKLFGFANEKAFWKHLRNAYTYNEITEKTGLKSNTIVEKCRQFGLMGKGKPKKEKVVENVVKIFVPAGYDITKKNCLCCGSKLSKKDVPNLFVGDIRNIRKCKKCRGTLVAYDSTMTPDCVSRGYGGQK